MLRLGRPSIGLLAALVAAGGFACSPAAPPARFAARPLAASDGPARLALSLPAAWLAGRHVFEATGPRLVKVEITGPDLATPFDSTISATGTVVLDGVPVGDRRLITVTALDETGQAVPGSRARGVARLAPGLTSVQLSEASDLAGAVFEAIAAKDAANQTALLSHVDLGSLSTTLLGYQRALGASQVGLLDGGAIASALIAAGGAAPSPVPAFLPSPGRLVLRSSHWPPSLAGVVTLDDPVGSTMAYRGEPAILEPVPPGHWQVTLRPDDPALKAVSTAVDVAAGQTVTQDLAYAPGAAASPLPAPLAPYLYGALDIGGRASLFLAGAPAVPGTLPGVSPSPGAPDGSQDLWEIYSSFQGWGQQNATRAAIKDQPFAYFAGDFYQFGYQVTVFHPNNGQSGLLGAFPDLASLTGASPTPSPDPGTSPVPSTPDYAVLHGGAAGTIDSKIYLVGGELGGYGVLTNVLIYDPITLSWALDSGATLTDVRNGMASAVVDRIWYLFGGSNGVGTAVSDKVSIYRPASGGPTGRWATGARMPTARQGASAVVVDGKVFVIGGANRSGKASSAVEVYDPGNDRWSVRAPLATPRLKPGVGVVDGKIVVPGGADGDVFDPYDNGRQLADCEVLTP